MVCQGYRALTALKVGTGIQGILREKMKKKCPQKIRHGLLESDIFFKSFTQRVSVHKIRKYVKMKNLWIGFSKGSGTKNM